MAAEHGEPLSERELEITTLVTEGLTNREIAARLFLSHNTIKVHLRNIFTKTGVASRTELSMLAVQEGWITIPGLGEDREATPAQEDQGIPSPTPPEQEAQEIIPLPPQWSWRRLSALAFGLCLALVAVLLPQRLWAPAAASGPGNIFGAGGTSPGPSVPVSENGWQELTPLPVRRAGMATVTFRDRIYVIGGMTDEGPSGRVDIYAIETNSWQDGTPRPAHLANMAAGAVGDELIVPGGCSSDESWTPNSAVHLYSPESDTWAEVTPLPTPLCAYALAVYDGRVFLFGGWDGAAYRAITLAYLPDEDQWVERTPPQQARGFGAAAALEDRILYVGGYSNGREWGTCEAYLPESDRWESCPSMLQPRGGLSLIAIGGRVYAIGGGWHTPLGFNERYTPTTGQWNVVETPIVGEWRNLGAVASDTSVFAIGGWTDTGFLNRTYAIEVMPWRVFIPGTFRTP
jgi:DNA-binding CsgD family transcriptional regulator